MFCFLYEVSSVFLHGNQSISPFHHFPHGLFQILVTNSSTLIQPHQRHECGRFLRRRLSSSLPPAFNAVNDTVAALSSLGFRVLFKNAATLSTELCEAKDLYRLGKLERSLAKADLLILDELSYLSFNRHQSELLFKVISDRTEKSSTIVTTNLPFSKWTELFENTTMVAALIDRITFRSHVLDMNGESYRLKSTIS